MLREFAPAKINLFLHVLGRREDGYHHLESLVSFADIGDELTLLPDEPLGLDVAGAFGFGLSGEDNLVLKAVRACAAEFGRIRTGRFGLKKNLPVAAGIGGGSADAAAALRLLAAVNGIAPDDRRLVDAARSLGADVPVCLNPGSPRMMHGIGHELGDRLHGFSYPALLVNPGVPVETRAVFAELGLARGARHMPEKPARPSDDEEAFRLLGETRNDLEAPALRVAPDIGAVLTRLRSSEGCRFARMSGSGATCFAIFASLQSAAAAAASIRLAEPDWWAEPCRIKLPS
jgi:4-diphosphocytidyl-2-C-methyl-D-erythritol kinase